MNIKNISLLLIFLFVSSTNALYKTEQSQTTNKGKAVAASVIIPGLGQRLLHNNLKSEIMLWTESSIWLLYGSLQWYGNSRNHDAKIFAGSNATANTNIKSEKYYRALERYDNTDSYNDDIRREARERFPDDPQEQINYFSQNGYFGDSTWNWKSDSLRFAYWGKRKSARTAFTRAGFVLGGALLNRLVSAIDCAFFTPDKRNKLSIAPNADGTGIGLIYHLK